MTPVIYWVRRDLRLTDNPALRAAVATGRPVIPVFIWDEVCETLGACPAWRLGLGVEAFATSLAGIGSRLICRRGTALDVLSSLIDETGATYVVWNRLYDPDAIARDTAVKAALKERDVGAESHAAHLLFEPWTVETKTGGPYRVYTPFWKAVRGIHVGDPLPAPSNIAAPDAWPGSDDPASWDLGKAMQRGAEVVAPYLTVGEAAAMDRLDRFIDGPINRYKADRDKPAIDASSGLSENLAVGEISPRQIWAVGLRAREAGATGAEKFLSEVAWREFAYHLLYHYPLMTTEAWRPEWASFPWSDGAGPEAEAWRQGRTGIRFVDAAMRELYVTGRMHNRARMVVASFLTKNLLIDWRVGLDWFAECLADWDPASNAMGWQWVAGSGPDAAPYFRVFNPDTQAEKFDARGEYQRRWIAERELAPTETALSYFDAVPRSWALSANQPYPAPILGLKEGRQRALDAYAAWKADRDG